MPLTGPSQEHLFRLKASMQQYPWGKQGNLSLVAQLAPEAVSSNFEAEKDEAYAEVCAYSRILYSKPVLVRN